ncbi:helix-turn-helix domain-containing protein [Paraburkholderia agricolaris]|uniref:helix-turn-helix domain-containing protein n=1 Tax=Paraburkholderia agricolaris TaxID=2152888 RepID=UPI001291F564|nr:helix-turn-helix domain-containing protein [Paraburkholderia agricolaris]
MTSDPSRLQVERFATDNASPSEQFEAWTSGVPFFDFDPSEGARTSFDMRCQHVSFGPFVLENRVWHHPSSTADFSAERRPRHIRVDQHDYVCFNLQVCGALALQTRSTSHIKQAGDLYVLDYGNPFEYEVAPGHEIALAVPRALLPPSLERHHGHSLTQGPAALLRDHLLSLRENLPRLTADDMPYVVDATTQLLIACVRIKPDGLPETSGVVQDLLTRRVRRYMDTHLLQVDLTPDRICKDVGLSRAKLYELFAGAGGVMREIRQRRLDLAHQALSTTRDRREKIRTIAQRFGFTDEKYFSRIFKARFGYSPSETFEQTSISSS